MIVACDASRIMLSVSRSYLHAHYIADGTVWLQSSTDDHLRCQAAGEAASLLLIVCADRWFFLRTVRCGLNGPLVEDDTCSTVFWFSNLQVHYLHAW